MLELKFMPTIAERDVDLIVVEEFAVNEEFSDWFTSRVFGMPVLDSPLGAWHSVSDSSLGESDIVHMFRSLEGGAQVALLIENKINAAPQPEQAARYRSRGQKGKLDGMWDDFRTCVIAPGKYLSLPDNSDGYDALISYEELMSFFSSRRRRDPRYLYKARVIREGIEKQRIGPQSPISADLTQFVHEYCTLADAEFQRLKVFPAKPRPAGSTWVSFRPAGYPQDAILSHQLTGGKVKLFISNAAGDFDVWEERTKPFLTPDMELAPAGKSVAVSMAVPVLDPLGRSFTEQEEAVRRALEAAVNIDSTYRKVMASL